MRFCRDARLWRYGRFRGVDASCEFQHEMRCVRRPLYRTLHADGRSLPRRVTIGEVERDYFVAAERLSVLAEHGVDFNEASSAFADPLSLTIPDLEHSVEEERFLLLGLSSRGRLLVVSHVERGAVIRLISARIASRNERWAYEEEAQ